ncbi:hypothetical protein AB1K54_15880 [Microbacterium sp. BWT-B31]|uniref:hypothetical protein n=1 Tax=Microbacterium sp. BWT-B31 TaxID=3232072 RepID=UPI0035278400
MNSGSFEHDLADVQSEMIAAALEYVDGRASDVYVYCTTEGGVFQYDPFFVVDGKVAERHKIAGIDTSIPRQRALVKYGNQQLLRLKDAAKKYDRPLPTQIKLHYVVADGSLDASYEYEMQYTNHSSLTAADIVQEWQSEISDSLVD